jgi:hypothetical protein
VQVFHKRKRCLRVCVLEKLYFCSMITQNNNSQEKFFECVVNTLYITDITQYVCWCTHMWQESLRYCCCCCWWWCASDLYDLVNAVHCSCKRHTRHAITHVCTVVKVSCSVVEDQHCKTDAQCGDSCDHTEFNKQQTAARKTTTYTDTIACTHRMSTQRQLAY